MERASWERGAPEREPDMEIERVRVSEWVGVLQPIACLDQRPQDDLDVVCVLHDLLQSLVSCSKYVGRKHHCEVVDAHLALRREFRGLLHVR